MGGDVMAMKNGLSIFGLIGVLAGCEDLEIERFKSNQALRAEIFMKCLSALPDGPISTKYNDWDEVVDACDNAAYYQSLVCVSGCLESQNEK